MNLRDKLTRQQVEERMELYREVFTTVRLLDVFDLRWLGNMKEKKITLVKGTIVIAMTTGRKTSPVKTVFPDKFIRTGFNGRNWNIRGMSFMR